MNEQRVLTSDFIVIGGGVIGLTVALEIRNTFPDSGVVVIEKESYCGAHASGRNSGVLHAGFYYTADSMKARFCRVGNARMKAYCEAKNLSVNTCGKIVVAQNEEEQDQITELKSRGDRNGVALHRITEKEAREIEPRVKLVGDALFSESTATVNPEEVMKSLAQDALDAGIQIHTDTRYLGCEGKKIRTSKGLFESGYLVNAAGLYADKVARGFGFGESYRILPFKGLYLYSSEPPGAFRTNIYPVPNLQNPFLGVHYTLTVNGQAKIGPTAIPCAWREHYRGLEGFNSSEFREIIMTMTGLFFGKGKGFRSLALEESKKYYRPYLVRQAAALAEGVRVEDYRKWGKPGIRAQLVHAKERKLIMDFCTEGDEQSFHILNAVSPAFTCAFPFAEHVVKEIEGLV